MESRLSPLQKRVLAVLAGLPWTLSGGGALAGYHLGHRTTRDLDLFFKGTNVLDHIPLEVESRLRRAGLIVDRIQSGEAFCRIQVGDGVEAFPIDLVAEPVAGIEAPTEVDPGVWVDTPHEILVNKLTALLGRWAHRDLVDVRALLAHGGDLDRALRDAPQKDGGFSPETLAWVLDTTPHAGLPPDLLAFKDELVSKLLSRAP